jgi:hypothetical protein
MLRGLQSGTNLGNKLAFPEGFGLYLLGFREAFYRENRFFASGKEKYTYLHRTHYLNYENIHRFGTYSNYYGIYHIRQQKPS